MLTGRVVNVAFVVRERSLCLSMDQSCVSIDHVRLYLETCAPACLLLSKIQSLAVLPSAFFCRCVTKRHTRLSSTLPQILSNSLFSSQVYRETKVVRPLLAGHGWINVSDVVV